MERILSRSVSLESWKVAGGASSLFRIWMQHEMLLVSATAGGDRAVE